MSDLRTWDIIIIIILLLVIFGGRHLAALGRSLGRGLAALKKAPSRPDKKDQPR